MARAGGEKRQRRAQHLAPIRMEPCAQESPALKVLVVEDDRDTAETLRTLLDLCGYQVTVAHSGFGDPKHRLRALAAGFDQHLVKPVDPRLLLYELQTTH